MITLAAVGVAGLAAALLLPRKLSVATGPKPLTQPAAVDIDAGPRQNAGT